MALMCSSLSPNVSLSHHSWLKPFEILPQLVYKICKHHSGKYTRRLWCRLLLPPLPLLSRRASPAPLSQTHSDWIPGRLRLPFRLLRTVLSRFSVKIKRFYFEVMSRFYFEMEYRVEYSTFRALTSGIYWPCKSQDCKSRCELKEIYEPH